MAEVETAFGYVHELLAGPMAQDQLDSTSATRQNSRATWDANLSLWIAGYLLDLWATEDPRLLGTGRRPD
jgi:hypothetical protein